MRKTAGFLRDAAGKGVYALRTDMAGDCKPLGIGNGIATISGDIF